MAVTTTSIPRGKPRRVVCHPFVDDEAHGGNKDNSMDVSSPSSN